MAMMNAYSPYEIGLVSLGVFDSNRAIDTACFELSEKIMAENRTRGTDVDSVCVIHRHKGIHRRFGINFKKNPGALTLLQTLFEGQWRIASAEEEKACIAEDNQATNDENQRRSDRAAVVLVQKAAQGIAGSIPATPNPATDFTAQMVAAQQEIEALKARLAKAEEEKAPKGKGKKAADADPNEPPK